MHLYMYTCSWATQSNGMRKSAATLTTYIYTHTHISINQSINLYIYICIPVAGQRRATA